MILRWTVEGRHAATFTCTKKVLDEDQAIRIVMSLGLENHKQGYQKNSHPILYDDNNHIVKRLKIV